MTILDPETGKTGSVFAAGNSPARLALSLDGKVLSVAVSGDGVVRQIDADSFAPLSEFRFRPAGLGGYGPAALAVMPGRPGTVAVYYHPDPRMSLAVVSLYENGVKRGADVPCSAGYDSVLFSPDGKFLFLGSFRNFNSPRAVLRFSVDSSGIQGSPAAASGGGPVRIRNGILYTSAGTLIETESMKVVGRLGLDGSTAIDEQNQRILIAATTATSIPAATDLYAFDLNSLELFTAQRLAAESAPDTDNRPTRLLFRYGADGLLYSSSAGLVAFHTPLAGPPPVTAAAAIVNAAAQRGGPIAPGEIVTIYGADLGPATPVSGAPDSSASYPAELGGVQVAFGRFPGTMLLASKGQINVIAPFSLAPESTVNVQVLHAGIPSARVPLPVRAAAPALFSRTGSGTGLAAVINGDATVNQPSTRGAPVSLFGTGGGATAGASDGKLARGVEWLPGAVTARIGGKNAKVLYAGTAPLLVHGVFQLNLEVPADVPSGWAAVQVTINGITSPEGLSLEIR